MPSQKKLEAIKAAQKAAMLRYAKQALSLTVAIGRAKAVRQALNRTLGQYRTIGLSAVQRAKAANELLRFKVSPPSRIDSLYSTHLGLLYTVVERWGKWHFADPKVDALLSAAHKKVLEKHRHAIFHAEHYDDPRITALATQPGVIEWAQDLQAAFEQYFRRWHKNPVECGKAHLARVGT